jgi:hypothetical protein
MLVAPLVLGHSESCIDNFSTSSLAFYEEVKAGIERRGIPDVSFSTVTWREGGLLSDERIYLRVRRGEVAYDICAAPFGSGFFFFSWLTAIPHPFADMLFLGFASLTFFIATAKTLFESGLVSFILVLILFALFLFVAGLHVYVGGGESQDFVLGMPITGRIYSLLFQPATYYSTDTKLMFRTQMDAAVSEAIASVTAGKGERLSPTGLGLLDMGRALMRALAAASSGE